MQPEKWKVIEDYPNYSVSSHGRVKRIDSEKILKPCNRNGYLYVSLCRDGKCKAHSVHHLVCTWFVGPRPVHKEVNHINGDREDNYFENLEWVTRKENNIHKRDILKNAKGGVFKGSQNANSKITEKDAEDIRTLYLEKGMSCRDLSKVFPLDASTINDIVRGKRWSHAGGPISKVGVVNCKKGSELGRSRLKEKDIPAIRGLRLQGYSYAKIGKKFGVNSATIRQVDLGMSWTHVIGVDEDAAY